MGLTAQLWFVDLAEEEYRSNYTKDGANDSKSSELIDAALNGQEKYDGKEK